MAAVAAIAAAPALAADAPPHRTWSTIPPGPFGALEVETLNFTASDGATMSYALYRPDVPAGARVPVILTAGPYFGLSEEPVNVPSSQRMSGFLIANFLSHGYAVAAASVRGTGWSGGCMEVVSLREARDLDEMVTHLATRAWSNGAVGMIGKSYDGGTPWMVAKLGNPHLRTIVPIAGVADWGDLLVHHGVPWWIAPAYNDLYWSYGFGVDAFALGPAPTNEGRTAAQRLSNAVCPETARGLVAAAHATITGDRLLTPVLRDYWAERDHVAGTLKAYGGSVFIVHGLQEDRVWPHQVTEHFAALPQEKKMWLGQWSHRYPDEDVDGRRGDFASTLLAWFERYLNGVPSDTGPVVEAQDGATLAWRSYATWPPPARTRELVLAGDFTMGPRPAAPFRVPVATPAGYSLVTNRGASWCATPLLGAVPPPVASPLGGSGTPQFRARIDRPTLLSGAPVLELDLDAAAPAHVVAELCVSGVAHQPFTWGATSTLYADASDEPRPFVPGLPLRLRVDLEDVVRTLPAGTWLTLAITVDSGNTSPAGSAGAIVVTGGRLLLPEG